MHGNGKATRAGIAVARRNAAADAVRAGRDGEAAWEPSRAQVFRLAPLTQSSVLFFFLNLHRLLRFASHSMFQQCFTILCAVELKDESLNYMLKLNNPMDKTKDLRLPSMKHAMQECNQQQTLRWPGCYM